MLLENGITMTLKGKYQEELAVEVAKKLMGKEKLTFTPHVDGGDFVVVTNVEKLVVTGKKLTEQKILTITQDSQEE